MELIKIMPTKLKGKVLVPPSKSLSHRAIICASLCNKGESVIDNLILSEDIKATIQGMNSLGAEIDIVGNKAIIKRRNLLNDKNPIINCRESGSTLRFLIPLSLILSDSCSFTGSNKLFERPLDVYYNIFKEQNIYYKLNDMYPLTVKGSLSSGTYEVLGNVSSQFISGLLFTLPLLNGDSTIKILGDYESKEYVNLTIDILKKHFIEIDNIDEKTYFIKGNQSYVNSSYTIESDFSQAAFFLVAKKLGNDVECLGLNLNSIQGDKEIINIINKYNNSKSYEDIIINASQIPDLVPIIAVLASLQNNKTTIITNAQRLRIKESDRLKAISTELNKLGANIKETTDGLIIKGKEQLKGNATVNSWNDHRIAMSLAIAATKCDGDVIIENHLAVNKSYPEFWKDYEALGGRIDELHYR